MSRTPATRCKSFYGKKVGQNGAQGKAIRVLSQKTSVNNSYRRGVRLDERPENFTLTPAADGDSSGSENEFSQEDDYNFDETPNASYLGWYIICILPPPPPPPPPPRTVNHW